MDRCVTTRSADPGYQIPDRLQDLDKAATVGSIRLHDLHGGRCIAKKMLAGGLCAE